ncbi:hypothetical protein EAE96_008808 [Botrytis aclada]|nr:hypothetical protein EAE96_008808 [Botrytis aclada]
MPGSKNLSSANQNPKKSDPNSTKVKPSIPDSKRKTQHKKATPEGSNQASTAQVLEDCDQRASPEPLVPETKAPEKPFKRVNLKIPHGRIR